MNFNNIIVYIIFSFLICSTGCKKDNVNNASEPAEGELVNYSDCKNLKIFEKGTDSESCIEYSYDKQNKTLTLKHINSGFNCCPENLYCEIDISADTVIIALCNCNCLYDMDIEIINLESGKYFIKVNEPYYDGQDILFFNIDLNSETTGSFCVDRYNYPWNIK